MKTRTDHSAAGPQTPVPQPSGASTGGLSGGGGGNGGNGSNRTATGSGGDDTPGWRINPNLVWAGDETTTVPVGAATETREAPVPFSVGQGLICSAAALCIISLTVAGMALTKTMIAF